MNLSLRKRLRYMPSIIRHGNQTLTNHAHFFKNGDIVVTDGFCIVFLSTGYEFPECSIPYKQFKYFCAGKLKAADCDTSYMYPDAHEVYQVIPDDKVKILGKLNVKLPYQATRVFKKKEWRPHRTVGIWWKADIIEYFITPDTYIITNNDDPDWVAPTQALINIDLLYTIARILSPDTLNVTMQATTVSNRVFRIVGDACSSEHDYALLAAVHGDMPPQYEVWRKRGAEKAQGRLSYHDRLGV